MLEKFDLLSIAINFVPGDSDKRPVVFVHGNSQNDTCGKGLMDYFTVKGHSFLSYDLPGHGDSKYNDEDYIFDDLLTLNQAIMNRYDIHNPILCGHSLGGMILAGCISKFQMQAVSLILCGSYDGDPISSAKTHSHKLIAEEIEKSMNNYIDEGFRLFRKQKKYDYFENRQSEDMIFDILNRRYNSPKASAININSLANFSARSYLVEIGIPILVLHGSSETVIPNALIEEMVTNYTNIKLEWYPNGGHHAFFKDHELTIKLLSKHYDFIAS